MTDNANDMCGKDISLVKFMMDNNNSIKSLTCICHSLNLVHKHVIHFIKDNIINLKLKCIDITEFINDIASYFNYSYKQNEKYENFKSKYLSNKKQTDSSLYPNIIQFPKIKTYCQIRFLSLGECIQSLILQWECLKEYL